MSSRSNVLSSLFLPEEMWRHSSRHMRLLSSSGENEWEHVGSAKCWDAAIKGRYKEAECLRNRCVGLLSRKLAHVPVVARYGSIASCYHPRETQGTNSPYAWASREWLVHQPSDEFVSPPSAANFLPRRSPPVTL